MTAASIPWPCIGSARRLCLYLTWITGAIESISGLTPLLAFPHLAEVFVSHD